jgi:hypothetical protein
MVTFNTQVVTPGVTDNSSDSGFLSDTTPEEAKLVAELEEHKKESAATAYYGHMHTIKPLSEQQPAIPPLQPGPAAQPTASAAPVTPPAQSTNAPVTPTPPTVILDLAGNDDLNVATLAREAERAAPQDEVVIKLH